MFELSKGALFLNDDMKGDRQRVRRSSVIGFAITGIHGTEPSKAAHNAHAKEQREKVLERSYLGKAATSSVL